MVAENIRKEFSLDHYDSLLANYGIEKANAYRMLFVNQRRMNKLETQFSLAPKSRYSLKKYNQILEKDGIVVADEYREFYQIKNQMVKDLHLLNMGTEEEYDETVDQDPITAQDNPTEDDGKTEVDPIPTETEQPTEPVETPVDDGHPDIEGLRQKYLEVFGKPVANLFKNNAEWIKNKIDEELKKPVENTDNTDDKSDEANPSDAQPTTPTVAEDEAEKAE